MNNEPNLILELTLEFSLEIIRYTEILEKEKKYNFANQLFVRVHQLVQMFMKRRVVKVGLISYTK